MKICLVILLLVPLALAHITLPTSVVFIDGEYIMAANMHARKLSFNYTTKRLLISTMQNNPRLLGETIDIEGDFSNLSLAIDSYAYTGDFSFSCIKEARDLKFLISACSGNVHLRNMTEEEQNEMNGFKKDLKDTNKVFELAYKQKISLLKSVGLRELTYEAYQKLDGFLIDLVALDKNHDERSLWIQDESLTNRNFTISGLPTGRPANCYGNRLDGLEPVKCKGQISFE